MILLFMAIGYLFAGFTGVALSIIIFFVLMMILGMLS
jgi:hypothetical protein